MTRKTVAQRLDQIAELTPFPRVVREGHGQRARPRRILPALLLTIATFGMGVQIIRPDAFAIGAPIIVMLGFIGLSLLQLSGPLRQPSIDRPLDEREVRDHDRSSMAGLAVMTFITIGFAFLASLGNLFPDIWRPSAPEDWRAIAFFLIATVIGTKMLYASWVMPRQSPNDEDALA